MKKYIISILTITSGILIVGMLLFEGSRISHLISANTASESSEPSVNNSIYCITSLQGWVNGNSNSPVRIDTFLDFNCNSCIEKELLVMQVQKLFPDEVNLVYHHFASSNMGQKIAEALEAAGAQNKFWEMHDMILSIKPASESEIKACAEAIGLNMVQFTEDFNNGKYSMTIVKDYQLALSQGIKHNSIFINGQEYTQYPIIVKDFSSKIEQELKLNDK